MSYHRHIFHLITRTAHSVPSIPEDHKIELFKYIYSICKSNGWHLWQINGYLDHIHMLIELPNGIYPDTVMKKLKADSSRVFSRHPDFPDFRGWNTGYASLTVSYYEVQTISNYIKRQSEHHAGKSVDDEMFELGIHE